MMESLFFALLSFIGYSFYIKINKNCYLSLGSVAALPLGLLLWNFLIILLLVTGLNLSYSWFGLSVLLIGIVLSNYKDKIPYQWIGTASLISLVVFCISYFVIHCNWVQVSFDSIEQITVGRALFETGFKTDTTALLASWGIFTLIAQGTSVLLGNDFLSSLQIVLALSLIGVFSVTLWLIAEPKKRIYIFFALLTLLSTNFFIFQGTYIHNNLSSALYLLIYCSFFGLALHYRLKSFIDIAFLGLSGFSMCRMEAPIFATLIIVLSSSIIQDKILFQRFKYLVLLYTVSIVLWQLNLFFFISSSSEILTPNRLLALIGLFISGALFSTYSNTYFRSFLYHIDVVICSGCFLLLAAAYFVNPNFFISNIDTIFTNLLSTGRWGFSWWFILAATPLTLLLSFDKNTKVFLAFSISFITLVILLGFGRIPYRLGWGDSANRIFIHLFPLLLLGLMAKLITTPWGNVVATNKNRVNASFLKLGVVSFLVTLGILIPMQLIHLMPSNAARTAKVIEAQGFCPPDASGRYDFDVALNPPSKASYAAALTPGPRTVKLELPVPRPIHWVELDEYNAEQAWNDFSIRTSNDGINWTYVFNSNKDGKSNRSVNKWRIELPNQKTVRFIALDYRSSEGQNRLLLKQMKLIY